MINKNEKGGEIITPLSKNPYTKYKPFSFNSQLNSVSKILSDNNYPIPDSIIQNGKLQRYGKKNKLWYIAHDNYLQAGDWSEQLQLIKQFINSYSYNSIVCQSKEEIKRKRLKIDNDLKEKHQKASLNAQLTLKRLPCSGYSKYLTRKLVEAFNVKFDGGKILIPLQDIKEVIWSYQTIFPNGDKRLMKNGKKKGCFHIIGNLDNDKSIYFVEGYATGYSVYKATNNPTIFCVDSGNIESVVESFRLKYPTRQFIIACDNDKFNQVNTGREKGEAVAKKYDCLSVYPVFKDETAKLTDFNDLFCLEGLQETRRQLTIRDKNGLGGVK